MATRSVRRGIGQAAWNKQFDGWYTFHFFLIPIGLGLVFQSWWLFLISLFAINFLMDMFVWVRVVILGMMALFWGYLAGFFGAGLFSSDAGWVLGILGFGVAFNNLYSGWQYWNDLT